jgi:hypothetical protein
MATIDPSIALGIKPIQIEDPINRFARQQELSVNMMKANEMQRGLEDQNALRQLVKEGLDPSTPEFAKRAYQVSPDLGIKIAKSQADLNKSKFESVKLEAEAIDSKLKQSRSLLEGISTPEQYMAWHEANHRDPVIGPLLASRGITADQSRARIIGALNKPGGLEKLINESKLGVAKFAEMNTLSEFQKQDLGLKREGQRLQYDPETQANIAGAKKREEGKVAQEIQGEIDVKANRKALATAGYDPVTGKDNISKLIQDSTGSFAGAGRDFAGRIIGVSTTGAESIAQLKTFESKLTQDILGGKLGAGISNTDREFIVAAIGQIADSTLPVETRQAAWNSVKERMRVAGMVEAPQANLGANVNTPGAAPAGKIKFLGFEEPAKK